MNSNYGKYVHDLKAFDKGGCAIIRKDNPVITAGKLKTLINYTASRMHVEDTWDSDIKNKVYTMCGTNFEAGKNFVINTPGLFGYFEGMKKIPFDLSFTKPPGFYAATGLKPVSSNSTQDLFHCINADELV